MAWADAEDSDGDGVSGAEEEDSSGVREVGAPGSDDALTGVVLGERSTARGGVTGFWHPRQQFRTQTW